MQRFKDFVSAIDSGEEGHAQVAPGMLMAAAGIIALGIGAANDTGWLAISGGVVGGLGVVVAMLLDHRYVESDLYGRIEKLEKK